MLDATTARTSSQYEELPDTYINELNRTGLEPVSALNFLLG